MMRLVKRGLMYGGLVEIATPTLVERYNRGLEALTGKRTTLDSFHIDMSGFAPEIGQEFNDNHYLNPHGCNRQFIIVSMRQKTAPLLHAHFSSSRSVIRRFIEENAGPLFALTARDAVVGELLNSIYHLDRPGDVMDIRTIRVEADTVGGHVAEAGRLSSLIERFRAEDDAWWDDALVAEIIATAGKTGDILRHPLEFGSTSFRQGNFHTTHFGGLFIFRDLPEPAVIRSTPPASPGALPVETVIETQDREMVAAFLETNNLVETIHDNDRIDGRAVLRQRLDFILVHHLSSSGRDLRGMTRRDLRQAARSDYKDLPEEFDALADVLRWMEQGGRTPGLTPENPAWFYTRRARRHVDRDLVNMLLAELTPLDIRQLFICHKSAFYEAYSTWSDPKRDYVVDFLANEYAVDKAGTRLKLFGPEPGMDDEEEPVAEPPVITGPWGPRPKVDG